MLWKATEWQSETGYWHCNCVDNLAGGSSNWYLPARILGISPADFLKMLINDFKPDDIFVDKEKCLVFFSWKSQTQMRKYKNWINKKARDVNFQI